MSTLSSTVRLGLIGDNIAQSRAPAIHECAGELLGVRVRYDRLVPAEMRLSYAQIFEKARAEGYRGLNITYPYKEKLVPLVTITDRQITRLGAVNTVIFTDQGALGYNTDWSGFIAAYRHNRGEDAAGRVCLVGAGGVGKAVAFGLLDLGVTELRLVERDLAKANALAAALALARPELEISVTGDVAAAASGVDGIINCTPVGMVGYEGTPVERDFMVGAEWVFDAIYTPVETQFLLDAKDAGLQVISGEELFFYQGLHGVSYFHSSDVDEEVLRKKILQPQY